MKFATTSAVKEARFRPGDLISPPESSSHQTVVLAFLSPQLPVARISEQLAEALLAETGASIVLVRLQTGDNLAACTLPFDGKATAVDWAPSEVMLQGQFGMPSNLLRTDAGFYRLTLHLKSGLPAPNSIHSLVNGLTRHFRHVLIEAIADEIPRPALLEFLEQADLSFLFLNPAKESVYHLDQLVRDLSQEGTNRTRRLKPIVCLAEGEEIDGCDLLIHRIAQPVHMYVRDCPNTMTAAATTALRRFVPDVRRLAREIAGKLVGLALSSGAAKGFAHIGVIQVLEEQGIEVDVVAGASIGSYIGALWTFGFNGVEMEKLARELEGRWGFWSLIDPIFPPRRGFLRGAALRRRLMRSIGEARFADLERPLRVVVGNLATLDRNILAGGEIAACVHASMAVPGICVPVSLDGEAYIDGGIVDPVPVEVLRDMGVSRVIAVNAIPTPDRIRYAIQAEKELAAQKKQTRLTRLFRKAFPIDTQLNYFARGNLFEIVMRSVHGAQVRLAEASCRLADVVLRPDICDDRWLDCRNPSRFIALGRQCAERQLDNLKALSEGRKVNHEHEFVAETVAAVA